jgi:hypothetical protein
MPMDSLPHQISLQIDLAAAAIALIALVVSIWTWRRETRLAVEAMRVQRDNDVIQWTNETIDIVAEIDALLRGGVRYRELKDFLLIRDGCLGKLSANIDKGRLYFPNVSDATYGIEKETAFQGHRQPILDRLVEIYDRAKDIDPGDADALQAGLHDIVKLKRGFVSEAQSAVEPQRRIQFLQRVGLLK